MICVEGRKEKGWLVGYQRISEKKKLFYLYYALESVNNNSDQIPQHWSLQRGQGGSSSGSIIRICEFCCTVPASGISRMHQSAKVCCYNGILERNTLFLKISTQSLSQLVATNFPTTHIHISEPLWNAAMDVINWRYTTFQREGRILPYIPMQQNTQSHQILTC